MTSVWLHALSKETPWTAIEARICKRLPGPSHGQSEGQGLVNLKNMLRIPLIGWAGFLCVFSVFHRKMRLEQPFHPQVTSLALVL